MSEKLQAIPTNVITGFLGVGKTTAILNLLKHKPAGERWAVLVNEFGEVGIDGGLFTGSETEEQGVFIREVPGGCMCCAAGVPMQMALNLLLARARPQRLLIEPTGLGHPREVMAVLASGYYREVLDLRATVTLVDARKIHDARYTGHATFNQQLAIADTIVANKSDQYCPGDFDTLLDYVTNTLALSDRPVYPSSQGVLQPDWLASAAREFHDEHHHHHASDPLPSPAPREIPEQGYLRFDNEGEGFHSRGWIFKPEWVFNARKLYALLLGLDAERIKGVFITDQGVLAYNKADDVLTETALDDSLDSRLECISAAPLGLEHLEAALLDCANAG